MGWLFTLERKWGKYAVPNLLRYMVGAQAVFYVLEMAANKGPGESILPWLYLDWNALMSGQWWRVATFYMMPPRWSPLFVVFYVFIVFMISNGMERAWGSFRINLFALLGLLSHILVAALFGYAFPNNLVLVFLIAFAMNHAEMEILLMFFIPVKWKWIGWFLFGMVLFSLATAPLPEKASIIASLAVLYVFVGPAVLQELRGRRAAALNRRDWTQKQAPARAMKAARACGQCGKSSEESFLRLCDCPRCGEAGRFWCEEHLGPHREGG